MAWRSKTETRGTEALAACACCIARGCAVGPHGVRRIPRWLAREIPGYLSMLVNEGRAPSGRIRRRMQTALGVEDFRELFDLEEPNEE